MTGLIDRAKQWARGIKRDVTALWIAGRDPRTPVAAKVVALAVVAYALSPIDLIPDFIPVLGYLDDLIIVPLGIMLAIKLIPVPLMETFRTRAVAIDRPPRSKIGLAIILLAWALALGASLYWLMR